MQTVMKTAPLALTAAALASWAVIASAAPPPGAGRPVAGAYPGGAYVRPVQPIYRPGHPGYRPGFRPGYPAYWPGYRPGWNAGYWRPRGGWYYGSPAYWGAWPYAAAFGVGLGTYAWGYPYAATPLVINTVTTPQVIVEAAPAVVEPAPQPASYWYYCTQPAGYFPYVKDCAQPWLKVLPQVPGETATPPQLIR